MSGPALLPRIFASPWEAQVFAMVVAMQDAGVFTAGEWSDALGTAIRPDGGGETQADYARWIEALEVLLARRGVCSVAEVVARGDAFLRASRATPHGEPIRLENDPLRSVDRSRVYRARDEG